MTFITEQLVFNVTLCLYALGALIYLAFLVAEKSQLITGALLAVGAGFLTHTVGIMMRAISLGRLPFANMYEFTIFFAWGIMLAYLITQRNQQLPLLGIVVVPVTVLIMSAASMMSGTAKPLMPALQSYWLQAHVATAVLAYGAFGVSFGLGVLYLVRDAQAVSVGTSGSGATVLQGASFLPGTEVLDKLQYRVVTFGFLFLTLVLITGAVWAEQVWGAWWSWDPKETWALITWLIYAVFLHCRFTRGWQGRRTAWLAVLGFSAVVFTLFGVTWLIPGMHSYS